MKKYEFKEMVLSKGLEIMKADFILYFSDGDRTTAKIQDIAIDFKNKLLYTLDYGNIFKYKLITIYGDRVVCHI